MDDVDALTLVVQDYLKVIWSATEWGGPPITTKRLAARFSTTQANVSDTVRRLDAQGLAVYTPYKPVRLTPRGEKLAIAMVRRHRLLETFLFRSLGYDWHEVHHEAERLEHAVTDVFIDRVDMLLGSPEFDPHGDRIPSAAGEWAPTSGTLNLAEAEPGRYQVVRVDDVDPERLARFSRQGIVPMSTLDVLTNDADVVADVSGARVVIPHLDAVAVRLRGRLSD